MTAHHYIRKQNIYYYYFIKQIKLVKFYFVKWHFYNKIKLSKTFYTVHQYMNFPFVWQVKHCLWYIPNDNFYLQMTKCSVFFHLQSFHNSHQLFFFSDIDEKKTFKIR